MSKVTALKQPAPATPVPAPNKPVLSPARQALANHLARCRELEAEAQVFSTQRERLHSADSLVAEAQARLDAVIAEDADALTRWAESASNDPTPVPRVAERKAATDALMDARAQQESVTRAAEAINAKSTALSQAYGQELARRGALKADVVREIGRSIGAQYQQVRYIAPTLKDQVALLAFKVANSPLPGLTQDQGRALSVDLGATVAGFDEDPRAQRRAAEVAWDLLWQELDSNPQALFQPEPIQEKAPVTPGPGFRPPEPATPPNVITRQGSPQWESRAAYSRGYNSDSDLK